MSRHESKSPKQARLEREAARKALSECAMPLCTGKPMWDREHGGLGICASCALDVVDHFNKAEEAAPLTERKLKRRLRALADEQRREQEAAGRAVQPGWVYYIRIADRIKVGYASDVKRRMRAYPPHAELLAVHPGTPTLEREMHAELRMHLAEGREWFHHNAAVMEHIAKVVAQFGPPPRSMVHTYRDGQPQVTRPRHTVRRVG